jgi:SAM-dependent methyltransferase
MAQPVASVVEFGGPDGIALKRVLNAGSGPHEVDRLHPVFRNSDWTEVRYDVDKRVKPDIVGSIVDLGSIGNATFDAIWCSHNLEHLYTHDVPKALAEFRRVLRPDGFALICTPDLETIAELVVSGHLEDVAYQSSAGSITALDMLYGFSASIERGNLFMSHHTGFTTDRLGRLLVDSGFSEVLVKRGPCYDLWALALMPKANKKNVLLHLRANMLDLFPDTSD